MADHGCAISLTHPSPTSDDDSSDQSPRSLATLSGSVIGGSSSNSRLRKSSPSVGYSLQSGGAIEHRPVPSSKKPRGRPPGSKNKPKPPLVITKENEQAMKPAVLEIPAGADVVETIVQFARRRNMSMTVLSGSGTLSNVRIRHPVSPNQLLTYTGHYPMLSLSGSYISGSYQTPSSSNPSSSSAAAIAVPWPAYSSFGVCLLGPQGNCFGGIVCGEVIAATPITVVVTTFKNPYYEKVMADDDDEDDRQEGKTGASSAEQGTGGNNAMLIAAYNVAAASPLSCQPAHDGLQWGHSSRNPNY
ncbi:hypothetical protein L6164_029252 [Bauhinia variegata]|uniref:Uncharacterized protein n=1 Tax=Bauhinia variegata TaxID=167791 RepID=A0ACB9L928_BAUVA|nr:hypothetical protein L6164_029252 [Bauhinia variegata]